MAFLTYKTLAAALVGAAVVSSQCTPPQSNSATVDLIGEFEGWRPDICNNPNLTQTSISSSSVVLTGAFSYP